MANDNSTGGGTVIVAFVLGALAGAAVALLFAPASGEETREYLGQKAREGKAKARDVMNDGRALYNEQRDHLAAAIERGREAFQDARDSMTGAKPMNDRGGQQA
jgi:gas vesicle protein